MSPSAGKRKGRRRQPERYLDHLRKKLGVIPFGETKLKEVRRALFATKGDKVLAAALLGIGKTTIYRALLASVGTHGPDETPPPRKGQPERPRKVKGKI